LLVKRDDLMGLAGGGNKVRKLEITMVDAVEEGARVLVTTGSQQSNHARLTAAAGARLGMHVILVLAGERPERVTGNLLLDQLLGAELHFAGTSDLESVADDLSIARGAFRIPFGGTNARSADAYRQAGRELLEQVPDLGSVVVAVGSGGTMAGLVAALGAQRVLGVDCGAVGDAHATVTRLLDEMGVAAGALRIDGEQIGAGYEHLTEAAREAIELTARTEGILLDPTYTGRAMAGLISAARHGRLAEGSTVFLHTGGLPSLFAAS
jgi:D-cysteine desulfhydrase